MARTEFLLETAIARTMSDDVRDRAASKLSEVLQRAHARGAGQRGMRAPPRSPGSGPILEEEAERAVAAACRQGVPARLGELLAALNARAGDRQVTRDEALLALVKAAGHRVAVEIDRH